MSDLPPSASGPSDNYDDESGASTPPPPPSGFPPGYAPPPQTDHGGLPSYSSYPGDAEGELVQAKDVLGRPLSAWWKRAVAFIIDYFVLGIPEKVLSAVLFGSSSALVIVSNKRSGHAHTVTHISASELAFLFAWGLISIAYFALLNGSARGQTVGQMVLGIAVRDRATGGAIGPKRAGVRIVAFEPGFVLSIVPGIALISYLYTLIAAFSPLWDSNRQGLHDKAAKTQVVDVR